jgi:hypothetical protein
MPRLPVLSGFVHEQQTFELWTGAGGGGVLLMNASMSANIRFPPSHCIFEGGLRQHIHPARTHVGVEREAHHRLPRSGDDQRPYAHISLITWLFTSSAPLTNILSIAYQKCDPDKGQDRPVDVQGRYHSPLRCSSSL